MTTSTGSAFSDNYEPNWKTDYTGLYPYATLANEDGLYICSSQTNNPVRWWARSPNSQIVTDVEPTIDNSIDDTKDALSEFLRQLKNFDEDFRSTIRKRTYYGIWADDDPEIGVLSEEFNEFMEEFEVKRGD